MTMNDTWGFKSYDHNWKSTQMLIRNIVDIASKGGNYLLNVGPTAEGEIPAASVERLAGIGKWMKVNGESIYGSQASPIGKPAWGRCTQKVHDGDATLYLQVFNWPEDGRLAVPSVKNNVAGACLLATGDEVKTEATAAGVVVQLPKDAPDPICSVVVLKLKGVVEVPQ